MQEIGRAGRIGQQASAILYFNNSDIAQNKDIIDYSIRVYCTSEKLLPEEVTAWLLWILL